MHGRLRNTSSAIRLGQSDVLVRLGCVPFAECGEVSAEPNVVSGFSVRNQLSYLQAVQKP
jgi:hypothetical protein